MIVADVARCALKEIVHILCGIEFIREGICEFGQIMMVITARLVVDLADGDQGIGRVIKILIIWQHTTIPIPEAVPLNVFVLKFVHYVLEEIGNVVGPAVVRSETDEHSQVIGVEFIVGARIQNVRGDSEFHFRLNVQNDIGAP